MAKKEQQHGAPDYWIDRAYTRIGNFIYPVAELYDGFYRRFWTRWKFYNASLEYGMLLDNFRINGIRRGITRDLGPCLTHVALPVAIVAAVVVCGVSYLVFRAQLGGLS